MLLFKRWVNGSSSSRWLRATWAKKKPITFTSWGVSDSLYKPLVHFKIFFGQNTLRRWFSAFFFGVLIPGFWMFTACWLSELRMLASCDTLWNRNTTWFTWIYICFFGLKGGCWKSLAFVRGCVIVYSCCGCAAHQDLSRTLLSWHDRALQHPLLSYVYWRRLYWYIERTL